MAAQEHFGASQALVYLSNKIALPDLKEAMVKALRKAAKTGAAVLAPGMPAALKKHLGQGFGLDDIERAMKTVDGVNDGMVKVNMQVITTQLLLLASEHGMPAPPTPPVGPGPPQAAPPPASSSSSLAPSATMTRACQGLSKLDLDSAPSALHMTGSPSDFMDEDGNLSPAEVAAEAEAAKTFFTQGDGALVQVLRVMLRKFSYAHAGPALKRMVATVQPGAEELLMADLGMWGVAGGLTEPWTMAQIEASLAAHLTAPNAANVMKTFQRHLYKLSIKMGLVEDALTSPLTPSPDGIARPARWRVPATPAPTTVEESMAREARDRADRVEEEVQDHPYQLLDDGDEHLSFSSSPAVSSEGRPSPGMGTPALDGQRAGLEETPRATRGAVTVDMEDMDDVQEVTAPADLSAVPAAATRTRPLLGLATVTDPIAPADDMVSPEQLLASNITGGALGRLPPTTGLAGPSHASTSMRTTTSSAGAADVSMEGVCQAMTGVRVTVEDQPAPASEEAGLVPLPANGDGMAGGAGMHLGAGPLSPVQPRAQGSGGGPKALTADSDSDAEETCPMRVSQ